MKKIFCLLLCLILSLSLLLVSCGNTENDNPDTSSTDGTDETTDNGEGSVDSEGDGNTDVSSGTGSGDSTDESTGGSTDESTGDSASGSTGNGSGTTDSTGTTDSSKDDEDEDDEEIEDPNAERVTIRFTCVRGYVSGDKEIQIVKGTTLSPKKMPVYEREGYVIFWSYDIVGEQPWSAGDIIDKDTELFGTWKNDDQYFDVLLSYFLKLARVEFNTTQTNTVQGEKTSSSIVELYDGADMYSKITSGTTTEEMWYVDQVYYTIVGTQKVKMNLSKEELPKKALAEKDSIFGIKRDFVKSLTKDGDKYILVVDEAKMTEALPKPISPEIVYTSYVMELVFEDGEISSMTANIEYTQSGVEVQMVATTVASSIGKARVTPPLNADEFETIK